VADLVSPTGQDIVLRGVHPNMGIEAAYKRKLSKMVAAMSKSVEYWIAAEYRAQLPDMAMDAPIDDLNKKLAALSKDWQKKFDDGALNLATWFASASKSYSDNSMQKILKDAGFTVKFKMSKSARVRFKAVVSENVGLIKSIPEQYFTQIEGLVMRSASRGRDLAYLTKELKNRYEITDRRAKLIAIDQNNKATALFVQQDQIDLGLTDADWQHSTAGKEPRESHVAASGKRYKIAKGMLIEGEHIFPGEKIRCRCISRAVIPGFND
jgi:uncharacterized protein with gpF-like domain